MEFKPVATGYCFLEAPRAGIDVIWFTDLLLGGLYRLSSAGKIDVFLAESKQIGGVAENNDGAIVCSGRDGILWLDPATGKSGVLLGALDGEMLYGVNDMYPDGKGGLYFGTLSRPGEQGQPASLTALYRLHQDGQVTLLKDGLKFSNGIGISPDGGRLYHNESLLGTFVYDILADGSLGDRTVFCSQEDCDGLAVDAAGGVWIAYFASGEIVRYRPDGHLDRRVAVPQKVVTSLCFGGSDWRDLYVTTAGNDGVDSMLKGALPPREASVYYAHAEIAGLPVPQTRFRLPAA